MTRLRVSVLIAASMILPACSEAPPDTGGAEAALGGNKVKICHVPPGNPGNAHTIDVGAPAVTAHLAHGDYLGACVPACAAEGAACTTDAGCCLGACEAGACHAACQPGTTAECCDGASVNDGVGECSRGTKACNAQGTGYGACEGEIGPVDEICGDLLDNDCDGVADDGCAPVSVRGWAWRDMNGNGIQDGASSDEDGNEYPAEAPLEGATFILRTQSGAFIASAVSGDNGFYELEELPAFVTLSLQVVPPTSWIPTVFHAGDDPARDSDFPESATVELKTTPGALLTYDCGFRMSDV